MEAALSDIVAGEGVVIIGKKKGYVRSCIHAFVNWCFTHFLLLYCSINKRPFAEFDLTQAAIENALGMAAGSLHLKDLPAQYDSYIMAVSLADTSNFLVWKSQINLSLMLEFNVWRSLCRRHTMNGLQTKVPWLTPSHWTLTATSTILMLPMLPREAVSRSSLRLFISILCVYSTKHVLSLVIYR